MDQAEVNQTIEAALDRLGIVTRIDIDRYQNIIELFEDAMKMTDDELMRALEKAKRPIGTKKK